MFPQAAVIEALREEPRSRTNLQTRTNQILKPHNMRLSKDAFNETVKPLINSEVLTKVRILKKETGRPMMYSISEGDYAQKQVKLILEMSEAPKLIEYIEGILRSCEAAYKNIKDSIEKNKEKFYTELNENLILLAEISPPMIAKMILYQTQSIENPYLIREIKRLEQESRKLFNQAGALSKKLGKNNHDEFITVFDKSFTEALSTKYNKFLKKNTIFPKPNDD